MQKMKTSTTREDLYVFGLSEFFHVSTAACIAHQQDYFITLSNFRSCSTASADILSESQWVVLTAKQAGQISFPLSSFKLLWPFHPVQFDPCTPHLLKLRGPGTLGNITCTILELSLIHTYRFFNILPVWDHTWQGKCVFSSFFFFTVCVGAFMYACVCACLWCTKVTNITQHTHRGILTNIRKSPPPNQISVEVPKLTCEGQLSASRHSDDEKIQRRQISCPGKHYLTNYTVVTYSTYSFLLWQMTLVSHQWGSISLLRTDWHGWTRVDCDATGRLGNSFLWVAHHPVIHFAVIQNCWWMTSYGRRWNSQSKCQSKSSILDRWIQFKFQNYELWTRPCLFKICELNFELVCAEMNVDSGQLRLCWC